MAIDVKDLNPKQLDELIAKASRQKEKLRRAGRDKVRAKLVRIAREEGYTIEELFGGRPAAKATKTPRKRASTKGSKVPPKYRNPADASQTWSGRGKQPRWFADALAAGTPEDALRI